jgi:hypothetical protein
MLLSGARMLQHSNSANEMLLRRKLEEHQQAAELQQAMELQSRRLMGLQLLDLKSRSSPGPIGMPFSPTRGVESPPDSGTTTPPHFITCCWVVLLNFFTDRINFNSGARQVQQLPPPSPEAAGGGQRRR